MTYYTGSICINRLPCCTFAPPTMTRGPTKQNNKNNNNNNNNNNESHDNENQKAPPA